MAGNGMRLGGFGMVRIGWTVCAAMVVCAAVGGCQSPALTVDDTVIMGDVESPLRAVVEKPGLTQPGRHVKGLEVTMFAGGREIHRGKTDENGHLEVHAHLPAKAEVFEARTVIDGKDVRATGRIHRWPQRTIVLVDIDETISNTDYQTLLSGKATDVGSTPLPHSVEAMTEIARRFNVAYLTARPRELLDKTRRWIKSEGFPDGPVLTSDTLGDWIHQSEYKLRVLKHSQKVFPNILIGIGNTAGDAEAYGQSGMLTVVVTKDNIEGFGLHGVLARNWQDIRKFFDANLDVLEDPQRLRNLLKEGGMIRRPLYPWAKRDEKK